MHPKSQRPGPLSDEEASNSSEDKYRMLVENSLQGLSIVQDSRFVFCNNTFALMTGYSVEELLALFDRQGLSRTTAALRPWLAATP